jgi:hypothetical protein
VFDIVERPAPATLWPDQVQDPEGPAFGGATFKYQLISLLLVLRASYLWL